LNNTRSSPTVDGKPYNTILSQLEHVFYGELGALCERQWQRCDVEARGQIDDGRECLVYERLCRPSKSGFQYIDFSPDGGADGGSTWRPLSMAEGDTVPWPIGSRRFDRMATDFNAPLLRGLVLPGVERGEMVTHFWRTQFGWREALEEQARQEEPREQGPLLLFNVTGVHGGGRVVAGVPRLPPGLLNPEEGGNAESLTDIDPRLGVDVEEAVRMSANFPWGFDLPLLGLGGERRRVIDGGVLDNSGIDTLTTLLERLEDLARDADTGGRPCAVDTETLPCQAQALLDELARRGVVLLEIDSGAKPAPPGPFAIAFANVLLPVHALSTSSYTRAVQASLFESARMEAVLRRRGERLLAVDWTKEGAPASAERLDDDIDLIGKRLAHVVYVLDTERLMTAWALSPDEKAQLLARFLAEDARQRLELRDQLEDIEGANVARAQLLPRAKTDPTLRAFLFNLSDSVEDLLRHEREAMARATERRRRAYERLATPEDPGLRGSEEGGEGSAGREGWMYVGYFNETTGSEPVVAPDAGPDPSTAEACETAVRPGRWLTSYVDVPLDTAPATLDGRTLRSTTPLHLRRARPDEAGNFDKRSSGRILPRDATVLIEELEPWNDTGFYFARVEVLSDP
jgi:predicted acylesterase/phospholipase RssA